MERVLYHDGQPAAAGLLSAVPLTGQFSVGSARPVGSVLKKRSDNMKLAGRCLFIKCRLVKIRL